MLAMSYDVDQFMKRGLAIFLMTWRALSVSPYHMEAARRPRAMARLHAMARGAAINNAVPKPASEVAPTAASAPSLNLFIELNDDDTEAGPSHDLHLIQVVASPF